MKSALIVSSDAAPLARMLERESVSCVCAAGEKQLPDDEFDLYIIDTPPGEKLAKRFAERAQVILLTDDDALDRASERLEGRGIITVTKPLGDRELRAVLKTAEAAESRYGRVAAENRRLLEELEDLKVINRAKLVLISRLSMTEPEAHRYIEKQAMDLRATKRSVAESILKTYEY
ncbi:MAG: ANTAR domain-containing protein [Clostridiales bacterium]|nr:ANTAR domain-containing protein [Clostridiales bacterium]